MPLVKVLRCLQPTQSSLAEVFVRRLEQLWSWGDVKAARRSQNPLGWKRSLRSSSPTIHPNLNSLELRFRQQHPFKSKPQVKPCLALTDLPEDGEGLLLVAMTPLVLWNSHTSTKDVWERNNDGGKRLKKQNSLKSSQRTRSPPRVRANREKTALDTEDLCSF